MSLDDLGFSPGELGELLSTLAPDHPLAVCARLGLEVGELRCGVEQPLSWSDYEGGQFHRQTVLDEYSELMKRRYPPTGNRELWILYGADGPPEVLNLREAA